ncbi:28S rRNA (cytosine-C(5))-methyltransferase [Tribolium castaneum]|uniref:Methyltransferase NSUN5-like Protein n=1 Tax=Tribolium castaneum TaxID=7070 RepID=D6X2P0_TRICA|nr:PREDICTED: probable 28S rRNA (cytosine-C(5))-methyltransferase [Tribolium castaneum]EFA10277.1 Putative methyltransferase NSUN5-like Protein [Tribolium castaneum]|eukprot:XP_008197881.1 PREDICTED: probable 28S rRNA (cytosine-C(5))-methyltransferase [Tribolium castaneum]
MFDHSIRVPRLYKTASKIAKEVSSGKGSIKQLVYECKHPNIKALYALIVHTFQKSAHIEKLIKKSKLLIKEPRFDPWLAKVLITELLWGKQRLSGQSKPVQTILAYEQVLKAHLSDVSDDVEEVEQVEKPRYVRVNTLKITVNEAIEGFREEGWVLKRYTDSENYLGFLEAVSNLGSNEFMVDLHIPYLLIFPPKTEFYQHAAYKNGSIILQDKASCLPVHILDPQPGTSILDMCAAPGMKTTQCAALIDNIGKIYAVEIGTKRFHTLEKIVESSGASCVEPINSDVLQLTAQQYPDIDYILVDPSCSGSGLTYRVETGQQAQDQHTERIERLAGFQIKILRHALSKFPKVKRVVYSTCSVYAEENEDVVRQVLETCNRFKLVPADQFLGKKWYNFGSSEFGDLGKFCLYAKPDIDLTSGFFVAVFERLEDGETNQFLNAQLFEEKMRIVSLLNKGKTENLQEEKQMVEETDQKRHIKEETEEVKDMNVKSETSDEGKKSKKKKKHKSAEVTDSLDIKKETGDGFVKKKKLDNKEEILKIKKEESEINKNVDIKTETKSKKKKNRDVDASENQNEAESKLDIKGELDEGRNGKKKKKKHKHSGESLETKKEESEPREDLNVATETDDGEGSRKLKRKKKHRGVKTENCEEMKEVIIKRETNDDKAITSKKKKKLKKPDDNVTIENTCEEDIKIKTERGEKSRKKHKDVNKLDADGEFFDQKKKKGDESMVKPEENSDESVPKKKKKKKDRVDENRGGSDNNFFDAFD